jgi:hypothetical protein
MSKESACGNSTTLRRLLDIGKLCANFRNLLKNTEEKNMSERLAMRNAGCFLEVFSSSATRE